MIDANASCLSEKSLLKVVEKALRDETNDPRIRQELSRQTDRKRSDDE